MKKSYKKEFRVKKEFENACKMVQAFVNCKVAMLLMNQRDGRGRIQHMAIKKEAKNRIEKLSKPKQTKTVVSVQDGTWMGNLGRDTSPKMHLHLQSQQSAKKNIRQFKKG